jgi:hypothetical protein
MSEYNDLMLLPCGGIAEFDGNFSYRCHQCMAVVGSVGMPKHCKDEDEKWRLLELLGGKGWDYFQEVDFNDWS